MTIAIILHAREHHPQLQSYWKGKLLGLIQESYNFHGLPRSKILPSCYPEPIQFFFKVRQPCLDVVKARHVSLFFLRCHMSLGYFSTYQFLTSFVEFLSLQTFWSSHPLPSCESQENGATGSGVQLGWVNKLPPSQMVSIGHKEIKLIC